MHLKGEEVVESEDEEEEVETKKPAKKSKMEDNEDEDQDEDMVDDGKGDADSSSGNEEEESKGQNLATIDQFKETRKKFNAKLKKDTEEEQKELAKVLMTNRQRKLYQKMEKEDTTKKDQVKKLKDKRKVVEKKGAKK
jgi:pescadillo protein